MITLLRKLTMTDTNKQNNIPNLSTPDLSIIIISYNTKQLTIDCIKSVLDQTRKTSYELIIIDNQSPDGSAEAIRKEFPDINLIASEENLGFAKANNLAAEKANGEYILLLNPDTVILDNAIDRLMEFAAEKPDAGIWGGRTLYGDKSLNPTSCWKRMTLWNVFCRTSGLTGIFPRSEFFNSESYGKWKRDSIREVDIVTGCFLLITKELWNRLDGFDPAFFMYGEEADLCLRAAKIGATPTVTPEATIIHYGGASEAIRSDKMVKLLKGKMSLIKRHWSPALSPIGTFTFMLWPLSRSIALKVLSTVLPSQKELSEKAQTWKEIWSRRDEWRSGYL